MAIWPIMYINGPIRSAAESADAESESKKPYSITPLEGLLSITTSSEIFSLKLDVDPLVIYFGYYMYLFNI